MCFICTNWKTNQSSFCLRRPFFFISSSFSCVLPVSVVHGMLSQSPIFVHLFVRLHKSIGRFCLILSRFGWICCFFFSFSFDKPREIKRHFIYCRDFLLCVSQSNQVTNCQWWTRKSSDWKLMRYFLLRLPNPSIALTSLFNKQLNQIFHVYSLVCPLNKPKKNMVGMLFFMCVYLFGVRVFYLLCWVFFRSSQAYSRCMIHICTLLTIHTNAQTLKCLLQRAKTSERPRLTHLLRAKARVYSRKFACSPTVFCGRFVIVFSTYTQFSLLLSYVSSYFSSLLVRSFFFLSILGRKLNILEEKR